MVSHTKKAWSRRYPAKTIIDADYADDLVLLINIHGLCCILWGRQQDALASIWFNEDAAISSLNDKHL